MDTIIREADINDANAIFDLWKKLGIDHMNKENKDRHVQHIDAENIYLELLKNNRNCKIFVAEDNSKIVGFIETYIKQPSEDFSIDQYAYILHCYVETAYRNSRIVFRLHESVKSYVKQLNIKYLQADVYVHNKKFYENICLLNFKPYRTRFMEILDE